MKSVECATLLVLFSNSWIMSGLRSTSAVNVIHPLTTSECKRGQPEIGGITEADLIEQCGKVLRCGQIRIGPLELKATVS